MNAGRAPRLLLLRHGETDWNATGRWQGHGGGGLSTRGRKQADAVTRWLASELPPVFVARSDLQRVAETAEPIEARFAVPVHVDARLRELDCGSWTGLTHEDIARTDPERYAAWGRGEDVAPGGGERVAAMQERVNAALAELVELVGAGETGVVVTHGGPIRVGVAGLLGRRVTRLDDACEPVPNCSATVLAFADGRVDVERYGDPSHLGGLESDAPTAGPL